MLRTLFLLLLWTPALLKAEEYSYLRIEIFAPSNAQLTEGFLPKGLATSRSTPAEAGDQAVFSAPSPIIPLYGSLDGAFFHTFEGDEGYLPADQTGDFILCAAKDGSYAAHARLAAMEEETVAAQEITILVNSRERISYDLTTDTFYYGTKVMGFPRDEEFAVTFIYGGNFTYYGPDHFEIISASGVRADLTILSVPEPTACGMILTAAACFVACRSRQVRSRRASVVR